MADKSFGVDQLDILGTGTPTISAPNQLNLDCNTVAISTSATVGNNLTVTGTTNSANLNVTGIGTLTRGFATDLSVSGISTISQPSNANPHSLWDVVNNGSSAYRFTGPGQSGDENNPNIYLVRGQRYIFKVNASGHPFQLRVANGGAAYSDGVTNNGAQSGNVVINVQHDAPAQLYYQCTSHGGMVGNIYIVGGPQVISGVLTATSFSGSGANLTNLPAQATIANNADNRVITGGSGVNLNGESNFTFDGTVCNLTGTGDGVLNLNTTNSAGAFIRFRQGGTNKVFVGCGQGLGAGSVSDLGLVSDSGNVIVRTNSNERLRIGSTGISTFSNDVRIVKSTGPLLELTTNTGAADATLRLSEGATGSTTNGGGMFYSGADNKLYITCGTDSTTKRITINRDNGNVGINETSPQQLLHVHNDTSYQGIFINGNGAPRLAFARSTTTTGEWSVGIDGTNGNQFVINNSNDNSNRKVIVSSSGLTAAGALVAGGHCTAYGNFIVGTSGQGIDFSATSNASETGASMSNELLDDYEEGSWTVSLKIANYNFNGAYSSQSGKYTKVGNKVTVSCYLQLTSKGNDSGALKIEGLPFTSASGNGSRGSGSVGYYQGMSGMDHPMLILIEQSDTKISLRQSQSTGSGNVDDSNISNSFGMFFSLTYFT